MSTRGRGGPLKCGRPGQPVTLTLSRDVVDWLGTRPRRSGVGHRSPVREPWGSTRKAQLTTAVAEFLQLAARRALIFVRPDRLRSVPSVSVVPLSDGWACIALEAGGGVADQELAALERLDATGVSVLERSQPIAIRQVIRERRKQGLKCQPRSILVVERRSAAQPARPVSQLVATA